MAPVLPTSAVPQVGSYVGYTSRNANIVAMAVHDPEPTSSRRCSERARA